MRRRVYAMGQPADHAPALLRQIFGKRARIVAAARRGVACADDGQARTVQTRQLPMHGQYQRRLRQVEQQRRIIRIGQRQQMAVGLGQPGQCVLDFLRGGLIRLLVQLHGERLRHVFKQGRNGRGVNVLGQAKRRQQRPRLCGLQTKFQRQPQPGTQFVIGDGRRRIHGRKCRIGFGPSRARAGRPCHCPFRIIF